IIDGDEKILYKIEENFEIDIRDNEKLNNAQKEVIDILEFNGIERENIKNKLISSIIFNAENVYKDVVTFKKEASNSRNRKIDKILTSKTFGIPIMLLFLGVIFWITIVGANYPSEWLSQFFGWIQGKIVYLFDFMGAPEWLKSVLIDGVYK